MHYLIRCCAAIFAGSLMLLLRLATAAADDPKEQPHENAGRSKVKGGKTPWSPPISAVKDDKNVEEMNLLHAMRDGLVTVKAEGLGDGRMTMSVTNQTKCQLRAMLPPGIDRSRRDGQFGGMGGMGGEWAEVWAAWAVA